MYYRVKFRACPEVYFFEQLTNDKAHVSDVIHRVKGHFKIKHSTLKVFDGEIELSPQDFIQSGRTYIVRRLPTLDGKRNGKQRRRHQLR